MPLTVPAFEKGAKLYWSSSFVSNETFALPPPMMCHPPSQCIAMAAVKYLGLWNQISSFPLASGSSQIPSVLTFIKA